MELKIEIADVAANSTDESRIQLGLDLTRRLRLLDELMRRARERRMARTDGTRSKERTRTEIDTLGWL